MTVFIPSRRLAVRIGISMRTMDDLRASIGIDPLGTTQNNCSCELWLLASYQKPKLKFIGPKLKLDYSSFLKDISKLRTFILFFILDVFIPKRNLILFNAVVTISCGIL